MRRRVTTRGVLRALAVATVVGLHAATALAVCGDANGDGRVSVSDGVQTLRAAAGLSSRCDDKCDLDGNGKITVSDGVNVLRKAAGLTAVEACPNDTDQVTSLIGHTLDLFGPLTKIGALGPTPAGASSPCDNPDGGFQVPVAVDGLSAAPPAAGRGEHAARPVPSPRAPILLNLQLNTKL